MCKDLGPGLHRLSPDSIYSQLLLTPFFIPRSFLVWNEKCYDDAQSKNIAQKSGFVPKATESVTGRGLRNVGSGRESSMCFPVVTELTKHGSGTVTGLTMIYC